MAFQFLAADASIPTASYRCGFSRGHRCSQSKLYGCADYLHRGFCLSSLPSSLTLHELYSGDGVAEARFLRVGQKTRAWFLGCEQSSMLKEGYWFKGGDKGRASQRHGNCAETMKAHGCRKSMFHGSAESMQIHRCIEIREVIISGSKKECSVCHASGLHHECAYVRGLHGCEYCQQTNLGDYGDRYPLSRSCNWCCLPQGHSSYKLRNPLQGQNSNACRCFLPNFLKRGFFVTEKDEKLRQRERQRAFLSLCARAMVASQIGQSTLLSFLWTNWPSMVEELSLAGNGVGCKNITSNGQAKEPDSTLVFQSHLWKALLVGFFCGSVIACAINSSMSAGALLDACLWLCLLCSLLHLAAFVIRIVCSMVMFISRGGITRVPNSCMKQASQKWVRMSLSQGFFAGLSTLLAGMFWLKRGLKLRSRTASLLMPSLLSRWGIGVEDKRARCTERGRLQQVCSQHLGFLQSVLPKQTKI